MAFAPTDTLFDTVLEFLASTISIEQKPNAESYQSVAKGVPLE